MTDVLTLALGEDRLSDLQAELDDLRAEVKAHRDGLFHVALDPMHAGQVVEEHYNHDCTEAAHDTFPIRHADGSRCVLDRTEEIR